MAEFERTIESSRLTATINPKHFRLDVIFVEVFEQTDGLIWRLKMEMLEFIITLIILFVIYKLLDYLLRLPTIGQYSERYILVTGCDSGFGQAIARRLDGLGCHVFAACLTETGQVELIRSCSDRMNAFEMDVTNHSSVQRAYDFVKSALPAGKGT
jgi:short chain dehydrogenase